MSMSAGRAVRTNAARWDFERPHPWYRRGTDRYVPYVQIVQNRGRIGRSGRRRTHRRVAPPGWGPKVAGSNPVAPTDDRVVPRVVRLSRGSCRACTRHAAELAWLHEPTARARPGVP